MFVSSSQKSPGFDMRKNIVNQRTSVVKGKNKMVLNASIDDYTRAK
jgi:hypothetical protein